MTEYEKARAMDMLNVHYGYIATEDGKHKELQEAYYDGMKTIIEDMLLGTDFVVIREKGKHSIENIRYRSLCAKAFDLWLEYIQAYTEEDGDFITVYPSEGEPITGTQEELNKIAAKAVSEYLKSAVEK